MTNLGRSDKTEHKKEKGQILHSVVIAAVITLLFCSRYTIICVSGESMQPVFESGSIVIVDKWAVPHRGDIVVAYLEEMECNIIKRVVAEGGSTVSMEKGRLILNREYVEEPYLLQENQEETWEEIQVPFGMYFLLGDNRLQSVDSRHFGCVTKDMIKGTVIITLFQ